MPQRASGTSASIQTTLRNPTKVLLSATDKTVDFNMLARSFAEAGRWAFGIMAADIRTLSDDGTHLYQPSGGFWIDPVLRLSNPSDALEEVVRRKSEESREDYHSPRRLAMGEGLGGALWTDASRGGRTSSSTTGNGGGGDHHHAEGTKAVGKKADRTTARVSSRRHSSTATKAGKKSSAPSSPTMHRDDASRTGG
eukprot:CAMPEP_0183293424 /NCGR_PEP_ID=MMETSP0160_2-20130417/2115_1 /TAXON_ID=2839 ORGANISM="Odontella Sinensis, Strain Grunow 1884" /NCGR_SAMPLE_ID=MMETSP0160_2 /ASSEMBLY_ACC=CAM_ASM_000250 /LENGTH=195 /DNA_ID=CAMNT_0025454537 /DNA_START=223 /DNA_END=805 /DNA_ORIENTATION=+